MSHASISEPVFAGFRENYSEQSTQYLLAASKLDIEKDKDDITLNIINSYFTLYKAQQTKKIIDHNIDQIKQRLAEVQDAYNKGTAIQNDVLRVQLQLSNTQLADIEAANSISVVNYNMNILLGMPTATQIEIDSASMFAPVSLKTSDDYFKEAMDNRMELKADNARTQYAATGVKLAKSSMLPSIGVGADAFYSNPNQRYFPIVDKFEPTWDLGINLSWDLTSIYTNGHKVDEANAGLMQSHIAYDMHSDAIKMEVNSSFTNYVESLKKIEVAKLSVDQAQENYRTLTSRYNNHIALLSDVLDANTLLLQSKINETLAIADSQLAYKNLLKATGALGK
jgi:outer membrane protein